MKTVGSRFRIPIWKVWSTRFVIPPTGIPIERGPSGRIVRLKIAGSRLTKTVGKELFIRQLLSETHLYSSAFEITREQNQFILNGKGWGHGVGLCQIGAALMAKEGYTYREILTHYFPHAELEKKY